MAAAAFGERPERWPLPTAATPAQMWLRAVACGGQGRYGAAYRDLAALRRIGSGPLVSLAHSTQGSFLRQLGWHTVARGWDGRALALAGADPEARADALIGLAADALGVGRFPAAATLAERRRGRRGLAAVGSVAATLLVLSGFGAMVVEARPGDTLYGLHAMFFDEPQLNSNQVMLSAKADLAKVQQMIDESQWDQAQNQLTEVSSLVQSMDAGPDRTDLQQQLKLLNTRIESRNPNATLPPAAPTTGVPSPTAFSPAVTASPPSSTPTTTSLSPSPSPSPSPPSGRHRHHGQTGSSAPVEPSINP
nr:hypothetical protein [Mycobacterium bohemicum]